MPLESCLDAGLENVQGRATMEANGWVVDVDHWNHGVINGFNGWEIAWNHQDYVNNCGNESFWGYKHKYSIGRVSAVFQGSGAGELIYGNCWPYGVTKVYLNDDEIGQANPKQFKLVTNFNYKAGDILKLEELDFGVIKINSLKLTCA